MYITVKLFARPRGDGAHRALADELLYKFDRVGEVVHVGREYTELLYAVSNIWILFNHYASLGCLYQ